MADVRGIASELTNDPLTLGYTAMTDAEVVTSLNTENRVVEKTTMSASQIFESIDVAEFEALTADHKGRVEMVLRLGDNIQISTGTKARAFLLAAFGVGTATRIALSALASDTVSRASELGLGGPIREGHVQDARRIMV